MRNLKNSKIQKNSRTDRIKLSTKKMIIKKKPTKCLRLHRHHRLHCLPRTSVEGLTLFAMTIQLSQMEDLLSFRHSSQRISQKRLRSEAVLGDREPRVLILCSSISANYQSSILNPKKLKNPRITIILYVNLEKKWSMKNRVIQVNKGLSWKKSMINLIKYAALWNKLLPMIKNCPKTT